MNNFHRSRSQRQQRPTTPHYPYNPYLYQQWQVASMGRSEITPFTTLRRPLRPLSTYDPPYLGTHRMARVQSRASGRRMGRPIPPIQPLRPRRPRSTLGLPSPVDGSSSSYTLHIDREASPTTRPIHRARRPDTVPVRISRTVMLCRLGWWRRYVATTHRWRGSV